MLAPSSNILVFDNIKWLDYMLPSDNKCPRLIKDLPDPKRPKVPLSALSEGSYLGGSYQVNKNNAAVEVDNFLNAIYIY